jgi:O-antigen ligase
LPFALACANSVAAADRVDWGLFELVRTAKFAIVPYVAHQLGRDEWWTALAAMGAAVMIQAGLGTMEVITGRTGVLWIFGLQDDLAAVPQMFKDESFYGWVRATATMAHPPNLACYLLLVVPPFLALALVAHDRRARLVALAVSAVGLVGLALTLSRWPALTTSLQAATLGIGLVVLREVSPKRLIAVASISGFVAIAALLLVSDFVSDRVSRDFERSVDLRAKEFAIAGAMLKDNPIVGVGLNNYTAHLTTYGSELRWGLRPEIANLATQVLHVRYISGPLNAFLLVAAETGLAGLIGFLIWCMGTIIGGFYAVRRTRGAARLASVGLFGGIVGVYFQQAVDYSYWVDPVLYAVALAAAMLARAPALFPGVSSEREAA